MILAVLCTRTRRSLAEIGRLLNREYTTVCHALRKRCGITVDTPANRLPQLSTRSRRLNQSRGGVVARERAVDLAPIVGSAATGLEESTTRPLYWHQARTPEMRPDIKTD
jgi:hypothetical protein